MNQRKQQDIKIIAAGHPRTGSQSFKIAVEKLGYTSTSGKDFQENPAIRKVWMDWARGGPFEPALQLLVDEGVEATTADWPASAAWKELIQRYPNAKVILFQHPHGGRGWVNSFDRAASYYSCDGVFRPGMFTDWLEFGVLQFGGVVANLTVDVPLPLPADVKDKLVEAYDLDNAEVRKAVPADQLLEYNVSQGWEPLCEFLGKPVPDEPFPNVDTVTGSLCKDVIAQLKNFVSPQAEEKPKV